MDKKPPQSGPRKAHLLAKIQLTQTYHALEIVGFYLGLYLIFFSPVIFSGRLLAPGDGIRYYLPNFYLGKMFWDPLLLSGFPVAADPQAMTWYPLSWIFSLFHEWNGFVISAYVLASSFTYGYMFTLTQSRLASIVSGIVYGMSGFMMAHLGHTSIIQAGAWLPLLIWALEKVRTRVTLQWVVIGGVSIACCALAGHPQILVYTLGIGTIYTFVCGWFTGPRRFQYYVSYGTMVGLGLALSAIQLLPSAELARLGLRAQMSFTLFKSYSLPPNQAIELLFPYLYGGLPQSFYGTAYWGLWNFTELAGYVGLLPMMLAAIGFLTNHKKSLAWFWAGVVFFAFLLTLGGYTPLAKFMYSLPAFNKFWIPARHFLELTFAVSVLSGLGIKAIQEQIASRNLIFRLVTVSAGIMLLGLTLLIIFSEKLGTLATRNGIGSITLVPWSNPAVGLPLIIFMFGSLTLILWNWQINIKFKKLFLLFILIVDLGSFGWFLEWRYHSPNKQMLIPSDVAQRYKTLLKNTHQRMVPIKGDRGSVNELPPNIARLWGVPSASGDGPLVLSRVSRLLSMPSWGGVLGNWGDNNNRSLDVMAVRYIFLPERDAYPAPVLEPKGISWFNDDLPIFLGDSCGTPQPLVKINLPMTVSATKIGIVSSMACSTHILDETEVVGILLTDAQEKVHSFSMRAGRDTSEWAYDRHDVLPRMKHRRAQVFQSFPVVKKSEQEEGHQYVAALPIGKVLEIKSMELQWRGGSGAIGIQKISFFNENTGRSYPLTTTMSDLANPARWRHVENIGDTIVYENLRVMPRAWLVSEVLNAKAEEVLQTIQSSRLPDGRIFNPSETALVEEPFAFKAKERDERATAQVVHLSNTRMEVRTNSLTPSFLILSDVYYPGWKATIDGVPKHIFQTNYVLRGIMIPSGRHVIQLVFRPQSFFYGAGISAGSSLLLILLFFQSRLRKRSLWKRQGGEHVSRADGRGGAP